MCGIKYIGVEIVTQPGALPEVRCGSWRGKGMMLLQSLSELGLWLHRFAWKPRVWPEPGQAVPARPAETVRGGAMHRGPETATFPG